MEILVLLFLGLLILEDVSVVTHVEPYETSVVDPGPECVPVYEEVMCYFGRAAGKCKKQVDCIEITTNDPLTTPVPLP